MADIFIFGDSITWGAYDKKGGWADRIKQDFMKEKLEDMSSDRCLVYPLGIPGDTSAGLAERLEGEILPRKPYGIDPADIFIIAIGINDTRFSIRDNSQNIEVRKFQENLISILNTLSNFSKKVIFIGLTPVLEDTAASPRSKYVNAEIKKYDEKIRSFCKSNSVDYVHLYEHMNQPSLSRLLSDGLHPNTEGHEWMYGQIKPHVMKLLSQ